MSGSPPTGFPLNGARATGLSDAKASLRVSARALRRAAARDAGPAAAAQSLHGHLMAWLGLARPAPATPIAVAGYLAMADELDVLPLLGRLVGEGHRAALPVVARPAAPLVFRRWAEGVALEDGPHRTRHPVASAPEVTPDVVLVPMLAFDRAGGRLGYGGGYYDRTLAALRAAGAVTALGVAYAAQEVRHVPMESFDEPLDGVLTEAGVVPVAR